MRLGWWTRDPRLFFFCETQILIYPATVMNTGGIYTRWENSTAKYHYFCISNQYANAFSYEWNGNDVLSIFKLVFEKDHLSQFFPANVSPHAAPFSIYKVRDFDASKITNKHYFVVVALCISIGEHSGNVKLQYDILTFILCCSVYSQHLKEGYGCPQIVFC